MARPGLRPMHVLPLLEPRRSALELCVFCPKLCRSACPVSNAEPRETVTPWGKMSLAWMAAHGDVATDEAHAAPAWACTGCYACREACDHRNVVADVLLDARDAMTRKGLAPVGARQVLLRFGHHDAETRAACRTLARHPNVQAGAKQALLVGCGYLRSAAREAWDAVDATTGLLGAPVALVDGCCGLPLRLAGDKASFRRHAVAFARSLAGRASVLVVDAGCAMTLKRFYSESNVTLEPSVELLVERAAADLGRLRAVAGEAGPVRYHDPCQLGRGLGVYDAPRAVLTRALGRKPDEFDDCRELSRCSGAGGLLPSTMPHVAKDIAEARLESHLCSGGGRIVTACASSLLALRKRAAPSNVAVDDLTSWIARAIWTRSQ